VFLTEAIRDDSPAVTLPAKFSNGGVEIESLLRQGQRRQSAAVGGLRHNAKLALHIATVKMQHAAVKQQSASLTLLTFGY
jgi:hypothetical protein